MRPKVFLETFGCQMNELDSELVLGQLRAQGYERVDGRESADVVIYNTCSVRQHAEQKVWSRLGELRAVKRRRRGMVIAVIGCMAERQGKALFHKYPHLDILCGPAELDKLPAMLHNALVTRVDNGPEAMANLKPEISDFRSQISRQQTALMGRGVRRSSTLAAAEDNLELLDLSRRVSPADGVKQAYVRITRGCNKFCSYCIVPFTRGPEVHRPPRNIIDEVKMLADGGAQEVTLLGQTVNHYAHRDNGGPTTSFADLLYQVHEAVPSLPRLRFVTSFPRDFGDDALSAMRDCPRICRYLHVPAQSGSDHILRAMNRGYTRGQYLDLIDRARAMMNDLCIASDFIVGFPCETEEDHAASIELVRRCGFKNSFIFKYSPRPGTAAVDRFADDVPDDVKRRRNNELLAVQQEVAEHLSRAMIGRTVEILVEGPSALDGKQKPATALTELTISGTSAPLSQRAGREGRGEGTLPPLPLVGEGRGEGALYPLPLGEGRGEGRGQTASSCQLVGRTRGDQIVVFDGPSSLTGRLVNVRIEDARAMTLFGVM